MALQIPSDVLFKHGDMREVFLFLFQIGVVVSFAAFLFFEVNKWVGLFLFFALVSSFYPKYSDYSLQALYMIFAGCVWYMVVVKWAKVELLYTVIRVVILVHLFFIILQVLGCDPFHGPTDLVKGSYIRTGEVVTGILCNTNFASFFIAVSFILFLKRKWIWCVPILGFGMIVTLSVGGILALCVGMSFYSVVHWRKIWPVLGGILLVGLYMKFINMPHAIERWDVWIKSLEIYSTFWGMGFGLGHFKVVYPGLTGEPWEQAHNDILQGMLEMGISFPIILGGFLVSTWIRFRKVLKEAIIPMTMLVIILVNSMVSFPWHIGRTAFLTVTILGILEIKLRSESWLDPKNHLLGIGDS